MKELQSFLTSSELIIVYTVIGILLMGTAIFFITKKTYSHRKRKQNTKELNKLVGEVHEKLEEDKINKEIHEQVKTETLEPIPEILEEKEEEKVIMEEKVDTIEENMDIRPVQSLKPGILTPSNDILPVEIPTIEEQNNIIKDNQESLIDQVDEIEILEDEEDSSNYDTMPVEVLEIDTNENITKELPKQEEPQKPQVEELEYEEEMNQTKAQEEIEKLAQELVNANATVENIDLTNFEEEQEKNAIISLDEFLKLGDSLYEENEVTQYQDEGNEPISIEDLEKRKQESLMEQSPKQEEKEEQVNPVIPQQNNIQQNNNIVKLDDFYSIKKPANQRNKGTKFKSSPIISPVYGIEKKETNETMELENTADYEKLDEEIRKTNEFLSTLRELQEKLE